MKKIKVALCITDLELGGAERCLVELATRLDRSRFCPVVYALGPRPCPFGGGNSSPTDGMPQTSCVSALENAGVELHCLGARGIRHVFRVIRGLKRLLAAQRPQLIQTFLFHANIAGRIAARRAGVGKVVSGIRVAQRRPRWRLWIDRRTEGLVDRHVCVSRSVAQFAEQYAALPAEKLTVIPNGVDLQRFPASQPADLEPLGIGPGRQVVTFVGRLDRQKGLTWLIDSADKWLSRLPDCDLLLLGKGPQRAKLQRMCRQKGISDRVHFAGWRTDVPEILAASRLLVLPSAWEGMPNVVLEAMAARLPVVAADVEGVRELLGPAAEAQTVPHGDSANLANKIVEFIQNGPTAAELGGENRRRAEENFSWTRMVTAYEQLWESLVEN